MRDKKVKKANSVVFFFFKLFIRPVLYLLYHFRFEMKTAKGIRRPCLILSNHQTVIDQFALSMGFNFGINFVATDTIFRHGLLSAIMAALVRPIPISKGSTDLIALKNMSSVIKDGGCVAIFPSGNRSFYGEESTISPSVGKLAKLLKVPLVLVQFRGGYNTFPRWKVKPNIGKMSAHVVKVVQSDDLAAMSEAQINGIIQHELCFNEFEYNKAAQIAYRGRYKAEYLESVLFYCPHCNSMSGLCSEGNDFFCMDCGAWVRINDTGFFERRNKADRIPGTILEWSYRQLDYIKGFDFSAFADKPVFTDNGVTLYKAERAKKEELLGTGTIALYADKIIVCGQEFLITGTTMALVGVRKLTIYNQSGVFAVMSPYRTNLIKYMICAYHLRNKALNAGEEYYGY